MKSNCAVIDLGTNTFNLLIVERSDAGNRVIHKTREPVKLGEGGMNNGKIAPEAFKRGTEALRLFNTIIEDYKCDLVKAFATSAMRTSSNGGEFVDAVRRKLGIKIEVIEGDREAELIWKGVRQALPLQQNHLIMDIGGGSTEFILTDGESLHYRESFMLGVSRLYEQLNPTDPMTAREIEAAETFLKIALAPLLEACETYPVDTMIGSSGSFSTFATMLAISKGEEAHILEATHYPITRDEFMKMYEQLIATTEAQRLEMPGIEPFRAKFIVLGAILTKMVIEQLGINKLHYSAYNMKEGILSEM